MKILRIIVGTVAAAVFGLPLLWLVVTALRTLPDFTRNAVGLPHPPTLANFQQVLTETQLLRFLANSLAVSAGAVVLTLILAAPAAYALARLPFRGRHAIQLLLLFGIIVPVHVTLLPLLKTLGAMHLADSLFGLGLVYAAFGLAITVFMLKNAFDEVPRDLEDAAAIDGAGPFSRFFHVALPLVRPTLAVAAIYNFVINFNDFALALTLIDTPARQTLPLGVQMISKGEFGHHVPILAAAISLAALPVLVLFIIAQRHLVAGLVGGAVKG